MEPSPASIAFARAVLGGGASPRVRRLDRRRAGPVGVFALELGDRRAVLKLFAADRPFRQARAAYARWLAAGELGGAIVPRLIAAEPDARALLLSFIDGERVAPDDAEAHAAAGRFLAALHDIDAPDEDPLALSDALAARYRSWLDACAPVLTSVERELVDASWPDLDALRSVGRVPCHRDFTPDNWLWQGRRLAVVDFEHARGDVAACDLAKLLVGPWAAEPRLQRAFWAAYGQPARAGMAPPWRRATVVLHALASLAWGYRHGDPAFVCEGRRALAWLRTSTTQARGESL